MVPPLQTALVVTVEPTSMTALSSRSVKERVPLLERARGHARVFCESSFSNCRGDLRGIVGASDGDLDGVCIRVVVVVGDAGDRVGQGDGFAGIGEVEVGVGDGVGPVDGT